MWKGHGTVGLMREWRQVSDRDCERDWNVGVVEVETRSVGRQTVTVPPSQGTASRRPTTLARNTVQGGWRGSGGGGLRQWTRVNGVWKPEPQTDSLETGLVQCS